MSVEYNYPFSLHSDGSGGVDQPARDSIAAETARATSAEATISGQMTAALGPVRASTAVAQADATLANGSYYYIPSVSAGGSLDLYLKVSNVASTYTKTVANDVAVAANTAAIATINETVSATTFTTEPPASTDPWLDVWTTITSPNLRWTTSIVSGALQIIQTQGSVLLRGIVRKDQQVVPGLWFYGEMTPATVAAQTAISLLIAPDAAGGGTLDATHGYALTWRNDGGLSLYRGDGLTAVAGSIPGGTPTNNTYVAGQLVGLGIYVNPEDPTKGIVAQVLNGVQVGTFQVSNLPTTGFIGVTVRNATNPITATISKFTFHPTIRKTRYIYVNASGGGSLGTETSPYTTVQQGLLAANERPGEKLELIIKGGVYRLPSGIVIPTKRYREIVIRCPTTEKAKIYGSTAIPSGSAAWTLASGTTHVWQSPLPKLAVSAGLIDMSHTVDMGTVIDAGLGFSPTPRAGFIAPFHMYQILTSVGGSGGGLPTVVTQKGVCDAKPGSYFNDPSTGIIYVHPIDESDANTITWERGDAGNLVNIAWAAATDMNACRVTLAGLHFFSGYGVQVLIQRAWVEIENCIAEYACASNGINTDGCRGIISSTLSQYSYGDCFHADPIDVASVTQIPTVRLVDCIGRGGWNGGDGVSNHELTNFYLRDCIMEYNGKSGMSMAGETHANNVLCRHNTQHGFSCAGMTQAQVRNYYLNDCSLTDSPIGLAIQSQQAGDESRVYMTRGRIANTAGHTGTSNRRVSMDATVNNGLSTFTGLNVLDGGNNSGDFLGAPNPGTISWSHDSGYVS